MRVTFREGAVDAMTDRRKSFPWGGRRYPSHSNHNRIQVASQIHSGAIKNESCGGASQRTSSETKTSSGPEITRTLTSPPLGLSPHPHYHDLERSRFRRKG